MASISIIGSGYVGFAIGNALEKSGNRVIFYDINKERVQQLVEEGHDATLDIKRAVEETNISFLCVPTPSKEGKMDLSYIKSAAESLAKELKAKKTYHLIVVKSTVVPTTTENLIKPMVEKTSGKNCGNDFGLCMSPEFLTQVNTTTKDPELKKWYEDNRTFVRTFEDKVVIGGFDKRSSETLETLFKPLGTPIFVTDLKTAEMIKYAHNLNLANRISYWNEIFIICKELGIDSKIVAEIVSQDPRIGKYGTVHGKAFGGACLPKDLEAFVCFVKEYDINPDLLEAVQKINEYMKEKYGTRE